MAVVRIGDDEFDIPAPRGMSSFALQQRVVPIFTLIGEVLTSFLSIDNLPTQADGKLDLEKVDLGAVLPKVLPALGNAFRKLPAGELEAVTRELLADTMVRVGGKTWMRLFGSVPGLGDQSPDKFDDLFAGRAVDVWRLMWEALKVWYPDFFGVAARFQKKTAPAASPSGE